MSSATPAPSRRHPAATAALVSAGALTAMAAFAHLRARRAEHRHPPLGRFLDLDGVRLHYAAAGAGRPVVMIHGAGGQIHDFLLSLMGPVARRWRAVVFDRPGLGYSTRPSGWEWTARRQAALFDAALRRLELRDAIVVGHAWGCLVAVAMALDHADRVGGLVLLSGTYYPPGPVRGLALATAGAPVVRTLVARALLPVALEPLARRVIAAGFAPNPVPAAVAAGYPCSLLRRPGSLRAALSDLAGLAECTRQMAPLYRFVRQPVAVVAGTDDRLVDSRQSVRAAAEMPHSSLRLIDRVGHMPHHLRPDAVLSAIAEVERRMAGHYDGAWSPARSSN